MASPARRHSSTPTLPPWQRALGRFFGNIWVELTIGGLIIASVALTLMEFILAASVAAPEADPRVVGLQAVNRGITLLFVVELTLRFLAAPVKRRFFGEYWIDILACLPLFRIFRAARAMRLLRLLRLLRLFGLISRLASNYPYVLRRGAVEYIMVCGLLLLTVVFGTGAMMFFEAGAVDAGQVEQSDGQIDVDDAFWFSVYSLLAGEPVPTAPRTVGGKFVAVFIMFMGLTIFAMFTGTVSAFMVERLRTEGRTVQVDELQGHTILCGWNSKAEIVLTEYQASHKADEMPVVVIAQFDGQQPTLPAALARRVRFLEDDFTRVSALQQAGIERASTCILLADTSGGRSEQDADARTILAALTVEKLNPDVYTCAELHHRMYGSHLEMGHVNDYVVAGEHSAFLLAQAALNRGLMDVLGELLTYQRGNQFYRISLPRQWQGRSFFDLLVELKRDHNAILVAVRCADGQFHVNPADYTFVEGDDVVVIAEREISL